MPRLNIRNLPEDVHRSLRVRAAKAGRSMEAEAREIIAAAVMPDSRSYSPQTLQVFVSELYAGDLPSDVVSDFIAERRAEAEAEWSS